MTQHSTPLADKVKAKNAPKTSFWDIAGGQLKEQPEAAKPESTGISIPKAKALNPLRDAVVRAERYIDNVLASPTIGQFMTRRHICEQEAMTKVDEEIGALETRMHTAWDFIDTLPDGDEKERSIDRFLLWEQGYRVAYDFCRDSRTSIKTLRERLGE